MTTTDASPVEHPRPAESATGSQVASAVVLDLLAVLVFVTIGRRSHQESSAIADIVRTAGPFLIALVPAWIVARVWLFPMTIPTGVTVWAITLTAGMFTRRVLFGEGIAFTFIVVAGVFLATCFIGWRLAAAWLTRRT